MKLLYLRKNPTEAAVIAFLFIVGLIGLPYLEIGGVFSEDAVAAELTGLIVCRLIGVAVLLVAMYHLGLYGALHARGQTKDVMFSALPAILVAINNLPIIALAIGDAHVTSSADMVCLFAVECLFVGAFEEVSFRGIIFPLFLQRFGTDRVGRFKAVIVSSVMFGALHFVNLLSGAGIGPVILQAGYSFLIGAMLAIVFFEGGSVFLCAGIHGVYNFCGLLITTLGEGEAWNWPTVVITAVLGVAVFAVMFWRLLRADGTSAKSLVAFSHSAQRLRDRKRELNYIR